jgi:aspartate/methionine/tyrosine aminotransferase
MSDLLLAKPVLPHDFIDVSVGEPHVVRQCLLKVFDLSLYELPQEDHMYEYPAPNGYQPLVKLLEEKYGAPIIITNGAKQALGACFYALKQMGHSHCGEKSPHWALIPPLAAAHGINMIHANGPHVDDGSPFLLISPNNPDGHIESADELLKLSKDFKEKNLPLIHDAAYYTPIYTDSGHPLPRVGDVQIYSISKMLGLSGLRLGYVVCPNKDFYKLILQYMETMTVGVSVVSQMFLNSLMNRMYSYPTLRESFENRSKMALIEAKKIFTQVDPEVLEVPSNLPETNGMFGWFKVGPKADFQKSKINVIDGALFGGPGMVRINLAFCPEKMQEIVKRLNSVKEGT